MSNTKDKDPFINGLWKDKLEREKYKRELSKMIIAGVISGAFGGAIGGTLSMLFVKLLFSG